MEQERTVWKAMVVGGENSFVSGRLTQSLLRHSISVASHLDWKTSRPPKRLAQSIDLVYICTDMVGHNLSEPCMNLARKRGIPYVNGTRKWAESLIRLAQAGFPMVDDDQQAVMAEVEKQKDVWEIPLPTQEQSNSTNSMETEMDKSSSTEQVDVKVVDVVEKKPETYSRFDVRQAKQRWYVRGLIDHPTVTNEELWELINAAPDLIGCSMDFIRAKHAREQLGIVVSRKVGFKVVDIDRDAFADTAILVGANECKIPESRYVIPKHGVAEAAPVDIVEAVKQEVLATPAVKVPDATLTSVVEALHILRAAMHREGYVEILIDEVGVKYKRVQVTHGNFGI